jgi:hypothetical protein
MDISKFNQELAYKVAKANGLEKNNRVKEAIKVWIEITEMVIKMSKLPKLDFSFRSMLIERTEQIIKHIKDLKRISSIRLETEWKTSPTSPPLKRDEEKNETKSLHTKKVESNKQTIPSIQEQKHPNLSKTEKNNLKVIESDDIKNLPKGFQEIETSEDFTIITPHDKEYVEKILNKDIDMSVFKHPENKSEGTSDRIVIEQPKGKNKMICFACGIEVPSNTKICPNCGTALN